MGNIQSLSFIGAGRIAEALVSGFIDGKVFSKSSITAYDTVRSKSSFLKKKYGINAAADAAESIRNRSVIVLAVKPHQIKDVLNGISSYLNKNQVVISVAAGITTGYIEKIIGKIPVIRVMPNTAVFVGAGMTAISSGKYALRKHVLFALRIFSSVGKVIEISEKKMSAVTAISGSGPAYVFLKCEALEEAGIKIGLSRDVSRILAKQTIFGAGLMLSKPDANAYELRRQVTSPGGTTEAAISFLQAAGYQKLMNGAVKKAFLKAEILGKTNK